VDRRRRNAERGRRAAGHTSVSFTLDRHGHLYPESDTTLHDRLEVLHSTVRPADGVVIQLPQ
jgi:hypothetical protein